MDDFFFLLGSRLSNATVDAKALGSSAFDETWEFRHSGSLDGIG